MEKKPFRGKYSGFLLIGEEKAVYKEEKLIEYYAKPFCTSDNVQKCIKFSKGHLIIRDIEVPEGEDFIWEQEDVESAIDRIIRDSGEVSIDEIQCADITQLVIPSKCRFSNSAAVNYSPLLNDIRYLGEGSPFPDGELSEKLMNTGNSSSSRIPSSGKMKLLLKISVSIRKYVGRNVVPVLCNAPYPTTIGFKTEDTDEFIGAIQANRTIIPLFLMKYDYIKLTACKCIEDKRNPKHYYVSCDLVYKNLLFKNPYTEGSNSNRLLSGFSIPGSNISNRFTKHETNVATPALSLLSWVAENRYQLLYSDYYLEVEADGIYELYEDEKNRLSGVDKQFAAFYINHYRQCYRLPLINFGEV